MTTDDQNTGKKKDRMAMILYFCYLGFLLLGIVLICRIVYIQHFWELAWDVERYYLPRNTKSTIAPERGAIIANDGRLLALSTPMYQLYMDCTVRKEYFMSQKEPIKLEQEWLAKAKAFSEGLAKEMGDKSADEYYREITDGRRTGEKYLKLGRQIDRGTYLRMTELPLMKEGQYRSGIIVTTKDSRKYPYGNLARRTIGYVKDNSNSNGNNHIGLEGKYDYVLHGKEGKVWLKATENGKIQNYDSTYVKPEDGYDVRTTLDITLQDVTDKALRKQITDDKSIEMGCAVIMDVKTGAIRAMVNLVRDSTTQNLNETYNMAIGLNSEPGSVFKATTLMTAIEDGYVKSLDDRIPTNNGIIPGYPPDDHVRGMKDISILHGFQISSNYVFRYLAVHNYSDNPKRFIDKLYLYKLGQAFDFDLDGLQEPHLPNPESKEWSPTDLGSAAMGYAINETPLHILTFYNAIANKGRMMKPYLVESIEKNGVVKEKRGPSVLNASICSKATADTMIRAMKAVTNEIGATASRRLRGAKLQVAGKTGTSRQTLTGEQIKKYGMSSPYVTKDGSYTNLATFVGFFPADEPKYSAIICLKSYLIKGSVYGGVLPAAALREIVDQIYTMDPELGESLQETAQMPVMTAERKVAPQADAKHPVTPDVTGLGLQDAMFAIESSGLKCEYSGFGHVASQTPKAGTGCSKGDVVKIILK